MARTRTQAVLYAGVTTFLAWPMQEALAQAPQPPAAEETQTGDVVIVTARFREESVQDIGASISAISADMLQAEGITDFEDLARRAGVGVIDRGPNQNDVAIRGVANGTGLRLADLGSSRPLVSQFLDDAPVAAATASQRDFSYFDFDRVEILRGPQPTLFGEGSVGGTIRYFSRDPDLDAEGFSDSVFTGQVSSTHKGGENYSASAATSLNLVPHQLAVRGVLNWREDDGFIDNPTLGEADVNDYKTRSGRLVLLYQPSDRLSFRLSAFAGRDDFTGTNQVDAPPAAKNSLLFRSPINGRNSDDFDLYTLKAAYDLDDLTLTSVSGYYRRDRTDQSFDAQSAAGFGLFTTPLKAIANGATEDRSFTQELRLVSDYAGPLNFTSGLFYQNATYNASLLTTAPEFAPFTAPAGGTTLIDQGSKVNTRQVSGFLELTYEMSDQLRLIGGARYVQEDITSISTSSRAAFGGGVTGLQPPFVITNVNSLAGVFGLPLSETFSLSKWLPRVAVEYDASNNILLYGIASTGVRNGNLNPFTSALRGAGTPPNPATFARLRSFEEDQVLSYEAGIKSQWLGGDVITNVALFHTRYKDPQILTSNPFVLTLNGPDETITGLEIDTSWKLNDTFEVYANGTYQDASFDDGALLVNPAVLTSIGYAATEDLRAGAKPVNSPELSYALGASFEAPISGSDWTLTGDLAYQYIDPRYSTAQNFPSSKLGAQNFVNVRLGLRASAWEIVGFVTNATNEIEYQSIQGNAGTPILVANGELDFRPNAVAVNRPRTIGIQLTVRQ
ncbi:MAG: TonB-dependent receptor [Hyphomonadaceae bacterium]